MLSLALFGVALAQSPLPALQKHIQETPPAWAVSCSPVSDMVEILQQLPLKADKPLGEQSVLERNLLPLLKPGALEARGVDPKGGFLISAGTTVDGKETNLFVSVPFGSDVVKAEALVNSYFTGAKPGKLPGSWTAIAQGQSLDLTLASGALVGKSQNQTKRPQAGRIELLDNIGDTPGCAIYLDGSGLKRAERKLRKVPFKIHGFSMFVPTRGGTGRVRLSTDAKIPVDRPSVVVVWNLNFLELMSAAGRMLPPQIRGVSQLREALKEPDKLPIQIPPGTVVVGFDQGPEKSFAMAIPLQTRRGRPVPARRIAKSIDNLIKELKLPVKRRGKLDFEMSLKKQAVYLSIRRGLIVVGTQKDIVTQAIQGQGQPWVSNALIDMSETSALVAELRNRPTPEKPAAEVRAGLSMKDGLVDLQVKVELPGQELGMAGMLDFLNKSQKGRLDKVAKRLVGPSPAEELKKNMVGIVTAQRAHHAKHDKYLPVAPWPRTQAELSVKPIPWVQEGVKSPFEDLGWAADGNQMGTYWVEVSKDGSTFTVFGALDADGDGVPATYKTNPADKHKVERETAEGIY